MRTIEASVFPVIPRLHVQDDIREVTSMTDYAHGDQSKSRSKSRTIETRVMFGACYMVFLLRAAIARLLPWRRPPNFDQRGKRESIFAEASSAAATTVTSSFMGF